LITRAGLALGFIWLMQPHHPDLGLRANTADNCTPDPACNSGFAAPKRTQILQRLHRIKEELRQTVWTNRQGSRGMAHHPDDRGLP
jgi:hypothetical protein